MAELRHRAPPVAAAPVVEADAHLQDALVEVANRVRLPDPDPFQRFMLFEEFLAVEFLDAAQQRRRRGIGAARGAPRRGLL